jgi:hypothetical protein
VTRPGAGSGPVFSFGQNVVLGSQYNQSGTVNVGKVETSTRDLAAAELEEFLAELAAADIVTTDGRVTDQRRLAAAVADRKTRLQHVTKALGEGAWSFLLGVGTNAATPGILHLIEKLAH